MAGLLGWDCRISLYALLLESFRLTGIAQIYDRRIVDLDDEAW